MATLANDDYVFFDTVNKNLNIEPVFLGGDGEILEDVSPSISFQWSSVSENNVVSFASTGAPGWITVTGLRNGEETLSCTATCDEFPEPLVCFIVINVSVDGTITMVLRTHLTDKN